MTAPSEVAQTEGASPNRHAASERIVRLFCLITGLGGALYGLLESPEILHQSELIAGWWTPTAVVAVFGVGIVLAATAFVAPLWMVRSVSALLALNYLVVIALAPLAIRYDSIQTQALWLYRITPLPVIGAALAWPSLVANVYLVAAAAAAAAINRYALGNATLSMLTQDFGRSLAMAAVFALGGASALRAGALLDRETTLAQRRAAAEAEAEARDLERSRFAALIHDGVLATLLDASRGRRTEVVMRQATDTLRQFDEFRSGTMADGDADGRSGVRRPSRLDASATIGLLRAAVRAVNADVRFEARRQPGFDGLRLPVDAASTLAAALGEAVRNSLRHAGVPGRAVDRSVTTTVGAGGIRIVLADDGAGFDIDFVPAHRLGIRGSILGRMSRLAGGAGFIDSRPGEGTTVTLVWGDVGAD